MGIESGPKVPKTEAPKAESPQEQAREFIGGKDADTINELMPLYGEFSVSYIRLSALQSRMAELEKKFTKGITETDGKLKLGATNHAYNEVAEEYNQLLDLISWEEKERSRLRTELKAKEDELSDPKAIKVWQKHKDMLDGRK